MAIYSDEEANGGLEAAWPSVLRAITEVARQSAASEQDVLRAVSQEFTRLRMRGSVALLGPDGLLEIRTRSDSMALETAISRLVGVPITGYRFDPNQVDLYRQAIEARGAIYSPDRPSVIRQMFPPHLRPIFPRLIRLMGVQPVIVAPLILDVDVIGTINVTAPWLAPEDAAMVQALADNLAIALDHVRSRLDLEAALAREQSRAEILEAVASTLDMDEALHRLLRLASQAVEADAASIALLDSARGALRLRYAHGLPDSLGDFTFERTSSEWIVVSSGEAALIHDPSGTADADPRWKRVAARSMLCMPLIVGQTPQGCLSLYRLHSPKGFDASDLDRAAGISRIASIAILNAGLYADSTHRAAEAQALIATASAVSSSLDLQVVLNLIAEQAKSLLRSDGSRIHLYDSAHNLLRGVVALHDDAEAVLKMTLAPGEGLTGLVFQQQQPLLVNDPSLFRTQAIQVPGTPVDELERMALVPLQIRGQTTGVMTVLRFSDLAYNEEDLRLLAAFATHAAIAIENADLYGQVATHVQDLERLIKERTYDLVISEARYRALVETSVAGIFLTDEQGRIVYANQALHQLLERPPHTLVGQPSETLEAFFAPSDRPAIAQRLAPDSPLNRSGSLLMEAEILTHNGRNIPVVCGITQVTDAEGRLQGLTGLVLSIEERKSLEAALKAERDRLQTILNSVGEALVVTDSNTVIEYVNPAWERLTGFSAPEAIGRRARLSRALRDPQAETEVLETVLTGRTWRGNLPNIRKDGTAYDAAVVISPILSASGELLSIVGAQYDISTWKEQDRLKTQFVSDVSHELRTPLTNIRLYLDLLGETNDPEKTARYRQTLIRESERLANLIDDLLSLSRLELGVTQFSPEEVDVNEIVAALAHDRRTLATRQGLGLEVECEPGLPKTSGDARLLAQVFTNLLTNAMNYTPPGGSISLRTRHQQTADSDWVTVEVADTGPGIQPDEQASLFRRFVRGRASQQSGIPGTGLGLAICKEILDHHQGQITVASEGLPGRGSRFTIWLPALPREGPPPPN
jgi:PAS domain S-box-containing protein